MTQKKSGVILATALILMTLIMTGCEQSYATALEATPTLEGDFATRLPADSMSDIELFGQQTATALAAGSEGENADPTETPVPGTDPTETPTGDVGLTPEAGATVTPIADPLTATTEPTATPVVVSVATSVVASGNVPATYQLKEGEYPYCIARRFNVNPDELLASSGLTSNQGSIYQPGLTLTIPKTGNPFPGDRSWHDHPTTYTATSNTTVYGAACYFGDIEPTAIIAANNLTAPYTVTIGTTLQIP